MNPAGPLTGPAISSRRSFLKGGLATAAALAVPWRNVAAASSAARPSPPAEGIIDTNVHLSRWPFRRLREDKTSLLVQKMQGYNVEEAWAGSFDGLLHKDINAVNDALAEECRRHGGGILRPFGAINPKFPDWEEDLRRCHEGHGMRGIRLYPSYHRYTLEDPDFVRLVSLATERRMLIQIACLLEDERTQPIFMPAPEVNPAPLEQVLQRIPRARVQLIDITNRTRDRLPASLAGKLHFDIARTEGLGHVGTLLRRGDPSRFLFGSHAPFFYYESSLIKIIASQLNEAETGAILRENAKRLLSAS